METGLAAMDVALAIFKLRCKYCILVFMVCLFDIFALFVFLFFNFYGLAVYILNILYFTSRCRAIFVMEMMMMMIIIICNGLAKPHT